MIYLRISALLFALTIALISCNPDDEKGIPAYLSIDSIRLVTQPGQGTASHKITDAWVYIDNKLIGAFELPATFPVLKSGTMNVVVYPGIKVNGISATRSPYPFFKGVTVSVDFIPGQVTSLGMLDTEYLADTEFVWMESFNGSALTIDTTRNSEVRLGRTSDPAKVFQHPGETNNYSATATLSGDTILFESASLNAYNLPKSGAPVFLEMNYRNTSIMTVGLYLTAPGEIRQQAILNLNPSEEWNKIYINLTPTITFNADAINHKVFIGFVKTGNTESETIYFDHLKLIY